MIGESTQDAQQEAAHQSPLLETAWQRAREGWAIHPLFGIVHGQCECWKGKRCPTPGKHPRLFDWPEKATTDPAQIQRWWSRWPHANIGGATGKKSGRNVLDIDPRNGGTIALELLEAQHAPFPETQETVTGSGGLHLIFSYDGLTLANTAGVLGAGLDIRSDGGNVVLPGSRHISGRIYEYEITHAPTDVPLAPMPPWLVSLLQSQNGRNPARPALAPGLIPNGTVHFTLVSWAGTMHARGMSPEAIFAALQHENLTRCSPVRLEADIRKIVDDITTRYTPGAVPAARVILAEQQCQAPHSVTKELARQALARLYGHPQEETR